MTLKTDTRTFRSFFGQDFQQTLDELDIQEDFAEREVTPIAPSSFLIESLKQTEETTCLNVCCAGVVRVFYLSLSCTE